LRNQDLVKREEGGKESGARIQDQLKKGRKKKVRRKESQSEPVED